MSYIIKEETKAARVLNSHIDLDKYDMYYVQFLMKTGDIRTIRVFCEKETFSRYNTREPKELKKVCGEKRIDDFFVERLIGEQGLMNKEDRDDYIYLGGKHGTIPDRHMIQANGKTGQQNFDENLSNIKLQVEEKERMFQNTKNSNYKNGKTYVIGDIHGMYGSYMEVMKKMTPKDHLIILGDVIDRGNGGIRILQDIMKRKQNEQTNPEITFLLGNHEMQFLRTIATMRRRGLQREDFIVIYNRNALYQKYRECVLLDHELENLKVIEERFAMYDAAYQEMIKEKGLTEIEAENIIDIWLRRNKGEDTLFDFLPGGRVKTLKERVDIYNFLLNSYVVLPKNIDGKDYLFVHAVPPKDPQLIRRMKQSRNGYKITELTENQYSFMLQERGESTYELAKAEGFTTICGHDPKLGDIVVDEDRGFIRIDTACGHKKEKSKLALYCVNDGTVEYFDEKETIQDQELSR